MVSPLWKASSDGDVQKVLELLNEPLEVDVEVKDHTGVTALIEAVKNGHVEVVRALLDKGADPTNSSSQGRPEYYTSDPAILDLLRFAQNKKGSFEAPSDQQIFNDNRIDDMEKNFYSPPPTDSYTFYPTINPTLSTVNDSGVYFPQAENGVVNGLGNLPPPEVARLIPCRYFPACRYGAQCMFAHPQTPYFQGSIPPVQYPPYDPIGNSYMQQYYPHSSFHPPQGPPPMSPPSVLHTPAPPEVLSPSVGHFSPNTAQSYGPLSPPIYSHSGQVHVMPPMPPLPPLQPQASHPHPGSQSQSNLFNSSISPAAPFPLPQEGPGPYPLPAPASNINYADGANGIRLSPDNNQAENYNNTRPNHRDGANHNRRGAGRPSSFGSRKPPCLFFPSGKCKNGDECRFPHVLSENAGAQVHAQVTAPRGATKPRVQPNGSGNNESRLGNNSIRDEFSRPKNGPEVSSRSQSSDAGPRPRFPQGSRHIHGGLNGHNIHKKSAVGRQQPYQQRLPNADDFPVLAGSTTPPNRNHGVIIPFGQIGPNGPTAAQVLQAPPPARKDGSKDSSTRGTTPDFVRGNNSMEIKTVSDSVNDTLTTLQQEEHEKIIVNNVTKLPVMSFAAAAATSGTADVSKEVSVSA